MPGVQAQAPAAPRIGGRGAEAGQVGFAGLPASISSRVDHALAQPGRPLDARCRGHMEQHFATSFGNVRIHDDAASHGASRALGAEAFAWGSMSTSPRGATVPPAATASI